MRQRSPPKCPATSNNPSVTAKPCQLLLYLRHGLRQSNSGTEFGHRSRCPKFFARICSQNFDRCHSFLLASSATGGARKRPPLHKGAFGDGGCGLPRRFAPRNDSPKPLSFRGGPTGRRGNPSFFRWTGVRAAEVVGPYRETGKLSQPPRPAAQRGVFAPAGVRDGWESEQRSSPKCTATPDNPSVTAEP